MTRRTAVQFRCDDEIWPIVDKWARENGYGEKESTSNERTYQKGSGFWVSPMMLKVGCHDQETTIEAWTRISPLVRLLSLFILPSEMGIESGGFRGVLPKSIARKAVNKLLAQVGQPAIV